MSKAIAMEQKYYLKRFVNAQNDGTRGATYEIVDKIDIIISQC